MKLYKLIPAVLALILFSCHSITDKFIARTEQPVLLVLTLKDFNPVLKIELINSEGSAYHLNKVALSLKGTTDVDDIAGVSLFLAGEKGMIDSQVQIGNTQKSSPDIVFECNLPVSTDTLIFWVSIRLKDSVNLLHRVNASCVRIVTDKGKINFPAISTSGLRVGVALRQHNQDNVNTSRIPGIATSAKGSLLAIFDARRESSRDFQGDIDICLHRSINGGTTWSPIQVILDMKKYGELPEKFNGVSDASILVDQNTGDIYIAGLWMHGIIDSKTGKWVGGLNEQSSDWNHQWRDNGSQPGYSLKESSQFLITRSSDDGLTWSEPVNITRQVKKKEWWLLAPAPGAGITMSDGTLVFPTEGRDNTGKQFSTITWSKDKGKTWTTGAPACYNTNECMVVELPNKLLMLNMREPSNRDKMGGNGRAVAITSDLGTTWTEHHTSRKALIEPACMASIYRHNYRENDKEKSIQLFLNPNSKVSRNHITLKTSFDNGNIWPEDKWLLLDEYSGNGYSCITSVNDSTIGVVYESSQANLVFQQIEIDEVLDKQLNN
jgi:sialidase-1